MLSAFGKNLGSAQKRYRQFVSEGKNQLTPWDSLQNQVLLGSEAFVKDIFKKIDLKKDLSEISKSQQREKAKPLSWYEVQSETRNESIKSAYDSGGYSIKEKGKRQAPTPSYRWTLTILFRILKSHHLRMILSGVTTFIKH